MLTKNTSIIQHHPDGQVAAGDDFTLAPEIGEQLGHGVGVGGHGASFSETGIADFEISPERGVGIEPVDAGIRVVAGSGKGSRVQMRSGEPQMAIAVHGKSYRCSVVRIDARADAEQPLAFCPAELDAREVLLAPGWPGGELHAFRIGGADRRPDGLHRDVAEPGRVPDQLRHGGHRVFECQMVLYCDVPNFFNIFFIAGGQKTAAPQLW